MILKTWGGTSASSLLVNLVVIVEAPVPAIWGPEGKRKGKDGRRSAAVVQINEVTPELEACNKAPGVGGVSRPGGENSSHGQTSGIPIIQGSL